MPFPPDIADFQPLSKGGLRLKALDESQKADDQLARERQREEEPQSTIEARIPCWMTAFRLVLLSFKAFLETSRLSLMPSQAG